MLLQRKITARKVCILRFVGQDKISVFKLFKPDFVLVIDRDEITVINEIAPLKEIRVGNNTEEWMDEEVLEGIRIRDKLLSKFKMTKSHTDHVNFKKARNNVLSLIKNKKKNRVVAKLNETIGKPKELWKSLKSLRFQPSKIKLQRSA